MHRSNVLTTKLKASSLGPGRHSLSWEGTSNDELEQYFDMSMCRLFSLTGLDLRCNQLAGRRAAYGLRGHPEIDITQYAVVGYGLVEDEGDGPP